LVEAVFDPQGRFGFGFVAKRVGNVGALGDKSLVELVAD
jgi:hypothetical protein